jgi:peptidoglycan hydrolase-like protein with peptidoglycan-binding domain
MAITTFKSRHLFPGLHPTSAARSWAAGDALLDAAGEYQAQYLVVTETGNLAASEIKINTRSVLGDYTVTLEGVDSSGNPDGTLIHANATATVACSATGAWQVVTFPGLVPVTQDQKIFAKVTNVTGTYNLGLMDGGTWIMTSPYRVTNTSGSPAHSSTTLLMALQYDGATPYRPIVGVFPYKTLTAVATFTSATTPDEIAQRFIAEDTVRLREVGVLFDHDNDCELVLYNAAGTALSTITVKGVERFSTDGGHEVFTFPGGGVWITQGLEYYFAIKAGASNTRVYYATVESSARLAATIQGADAYYAARTDAGAWTASTDRHLWVSFWYDAIDIPAGGLMTHPGMAGGMKG